jgi:hypothetical protein
MAQLVEQRPYKAKVGSSSLSGSTFLAAFCVPGGASGTLEAMTMRSLRLPVLSLAAVAALSACTAEAPPPVAGGSAAPNAAPSTNTVQDPAAMLEVEDQTSEGPTVFAKAAVTKGGFVVVYADEGRNTLGTGIVPPGTEPTDVLVSLAEEPTEEIQLTARLFADTDGNGLYGAGDEPVSNGEDDDSDDVESFPGEQEAFSFTGKKVVNS